LARSRWSCARVVVVHIGRVVLYCAFKPEFRHGIFRNFHYPRHDIVPWCNGIVAIYRIRHPLRPKHQAKRKEQKSPVIWILTIGILVQFGWEFVLAVSGIRNQSLNTIIVNSLLETNMGLPYLYLIHQAINKKINEELQPVVLEAKRLLL